MKSYSVCMRVKPELKTEEDIGDFWTLITTALPLEEVILRYESKGMDVRYLTPIPPFRQDLPS